MSLDMAQNFCSGTVTATTSTTVTYSNTGAVDFPTTLTAPYDITIWNSTLYSVPQLDPNVSIFRVTSATSTIFTGSWVSPSDEYAAGTTLSLISGDVYSCTLFITAKMIEDLNTLLFGNLTSSNLSSTAGITGSQLSSPLDFSQNVTLGGTTTNSGTINGGTVSGATLSGTTTNSGTINGGTVSGATLSGTTTNSGTINGGAVNPSTITASGLITANDGIDVAGGTITVPNATASDQPVALGQVANSSPLVTISSTSSTATNNSVSLNFTAPSNGYLVIIINVGFSANQTNITLNVSSSLSGLVSYSTSQGGYQTMSLGVLSMSSGQSTTITGTITIGTAAYISMVPLTFFVPTP